MEANKEIAVAWGAVFGLLQKAKNDDEILEALDRKLTEAQKEKIEDAFAQQVNEISQDPNWVTELYEAYFVPHFDESEKRLRREVTDFLKMAGINVDKVLERTRIVRTVTAAGGDPVKAIGHYLFLRTAVDPLAADVIENRLEDPRNIRTLLRILVARRFIELHFAYHECVGSKASPPAGWDKEKLTSEKELFHQLEEDIRKGMETFITGVQEQLERECEQKASELNITGSFRRPLFIVFCEVTKLVGEFLVATFRFSLHLLYRAAGIELKGAPGKGAPGVRDASGE